MSGDGSPHHRAMRRVVVLVFCCFLLVILFGHRSPDAPSPRSNGIEAIPGFAAKPPPAASPELYQSIPRYANRSLPPGHVFPTNISTAFMGTWNRSAGTSPFLTTTSGVVISQIHSLKTPIRGVSFVLGSIWMRAGRFSSNPQTDRALVGVYLEDHGALLARTLPSSNLTSLDYRGLANNSTFIANLVHLLLDPPSNASVPLIPETEPCQFNVDLLLAPVPIEVPVPQQTVLGMAESIPDATGKTTLAPIHVVGTMESQHCGLTLDVTMDLFPHDYYNAKAQHYINLLILAVCTQIALSRKQMSGSTQSNAQRVSLITIGQQAIIDTYLCLLHLALGLKDPVFFNAFAVLSFLIFLLFSVYEMPYLQAIWKARRPSEFAEGLESMRRQLAILNLRFYMATALGFALFLFTPGSLYVFVVYSFWWPQILHNALKDHRNPLSMEYVVGMSVTRLLIPLYLLLCPHNVTDLEPQPLLGVSLLCFVALQVGILYLQTRLGSRFMIPAQFLPPKYNYYRPLPEGFTEDCVVCMDSMTDYAAEPQHPSLMVAPCDHVFHAACLQQWMDIKMDCPTCRAPLEPP
jgi:hypothetical protein